MFEPGKSSLFDKEYENCDEYRWRQRTENEKRIKFIFFSNFSPADSYKFRKRTENDEDFETRDVDLNYFRNRFIRALYTRDSKDCSIYQNRTVKQMFTAFENMKDDESLEPYDCYIFVFLTFMSNGFGKMEKIHFHSSTITIDEIWDKVSQVPQMYNKPKIFLVQADDLGLLEDPLVYYKGGFDVLPKKIPTDADRLTIISTIPADRYVEEGDPSFLIQAFVEEVAKNKKNTTDQLDLQSLAVIIGRRVLHMVSTSRGERTAEMAAKKMLQIPVTTSTFTKQLYL